MWPLEAKIMKTPRQVANYISDVRDEFLTCRYAPFSGSGAMLAYLLQGEADDALATIATALDCMLDTLPEHLGRPIRKSRHNRKVPFGKSYPASFDCYHLVLCYFELTRSADKQGSISDPPAS